MGFMRRFDPGYAAAKEKIEQGAIGRPVVFKSSSRDPFRPSLEYANPASSGGIMVDMGIHDFDLARWFMGDVDTVLAAGAVLAYPEMASIGDIDNAIATLVFADGRLGVIDLTRNGVYGYDISTELLGDAGTIRVGYLRETPLYTMTKNNVAHDTVPYFMERFERAYTLQLRNFAQNVLHDRVPPVVIKDGVEALRIALAATAAHHTGTAGEGQQHSVRARCALRFASPLSPSPSRTPALVEQRLHLCQRRHRRYRARASCSSTLQPHSRSEACPARAISAAIRR